MRVDRGGFVSELGNYIGGQGLKPGGAGAVLLKIILQVDFAQSNLATNRLKEFPTDTSSYRVALQATKKTGLLKEEKCHREYGNMEMSFSLGLVQRKMSDAMLIFHK